jgi:iron complex outermembrane recepter protein
MRQLKGVLYLATVAPCALFASGVLAQTTPSLAEPAPQVATTICGSAWKRDPVSGVIGVE